MRTVTSILGVVVTAVLAGCGAKAKEDPRPGTLHADGTTTAAVRDVSDDGCVTGEYWTLDVDPALTCDGLLAIAKAHTCGELCGDDDSTICDLDGADVTPPIFVGPAYWVKGYAPACPPMPTRLTCSKKHYDVNPTKTCFIEGRRTEGLHDAPGDAYGSVGSYFAHAAHLEAAAVLAFERLAIELEAHGAPHALLVRIERAAGEERRHVALASALARRFGAEPLPATAEPPPNVRSLLAIACENVVEGVVRETLGAAIALHRARCAADAGVRVALAAIAADECRHAELSWDLHAWLDAHLTTDEREVVETARRAAIAELIEEVESTEPPAELVRIAGVPSRTAARRLAEGLGEALWQRAA